MKTFFALAATLTFRTAASSTGERVLRVHGGLSDFEVWIQKRQPRPKRHALPFIGENGAAPVTVR